MVSANQDLWIVVVELVVKKEDHFWIETKTMSCFSNQKESRLYHFLCCYCCYWL